VSGSLQGGRRGLWRTRAGLLDLEHEDGWYTMTLRKLWLFPLSVLLGGAVVVLPAVAAPETKTIEAITGCSNIYPSYPCWSPSTVTIESGGVVKFTNKSSSLEQGVRWLGSAPTCENVPSSNQKGLWEGSCTFTQPGTYRFEGTQIYSYSGEVVVTEPSTTTTTTTGSSATTPTMSTPSGQPATAGAQVAPSTTGAGGSPLAGSPTSAVKLAATQNGQALHGSIDIPQDGAGGRLEVELLATRASLASAHHAAPVLLGRLVRPSVATGTVSFAVALDAKGRHALRARHRLQLSVKVLLTNARGPVLDLTRSVTLRS
jgi:plastocyanin